MSVRQHTFGKAEMSGKRESRGVRESRANNNAKIVSPARRNLNKLGDMNTKFFEQSHNEVMVYEGSFNTKANDNTIIEEDSIPFGSSTHPDQ